MSTVTTLPPETIAKLKADNPNDELHAVPTDLGVIVLKTPNTPIVLRYQANLARAKEPQGRMNADNQYVLDACVYPDSTAVSGWFDKRPRLGELLTFSLNKWASGAVEAEEEKL